MPSLDASMQPVGEAVALLAEVGSNDSLECAHGSVTENYSELKRLAAIYLRRERSGHILQATALVHETYLKLAARPPDHWHDRAHFLASAAKVMRWILADDGRRHRALKRGAGMGDLQYDDFSFADSRGHDQMGQLNEALTRLAKFAPRQAQVVELRFFGGMTEDEIANHLGLCSRTIKRDWTIAKAWLYGELTPKPVR